MRKLPWEKHWFQFLISFFMTISLKACINAPAESLGFSNSFLSFLIGGGYLYILVSIVKSRDWENIGSRMLNLCMGFGTCFAGAVVAGVQLDRQGFVDFTDIGNYFAVLVLGVSFSPLLAKMMIILDNGSRKPTENAACKNLFWKIWIFFMLVYFVVLLAVWPGFFSYDAGAETYMVFTEKYSLHHPILHVLLLGWTLRVALHFFHSYNAGIVIYLLFQMMIVSGCFSYMICTLRKMGVRRILCGIGTLFLALFPVVDIFVCCTTKDVLFSGGVVLLMALLLEMAQDKEAFWALRRKKLLFAAASLLILFFRNNGIYAYIIFTIVFLWVYRKDWKKFFPALASAYIIFGLTTGLLTAFFRATPGEISEMLCVPMQQLARVHEESIESFSEEDLETLYSLIPKVILEDYNPKLADSVKINFLEDNFKADPQKYISLWFRMGMKKPDIYLNSFLMNTYGYWYPDTVIDGYERESYVKYYGESTYFEYSIDDPAQKHSFLPALDRFYEKISLEIYQQKVPVISMLFSIGFWKWLYVFAGVYLWIFNDRKQLLCLLPVGLLYLTVLLGPVAIVRYVLYFFFGAPVLLAILFDRKALSQRSDKE